MLHGTYRGKFSVFPCFADSPAVTRTVAQPEGPGRRGLLALAPKPPDAESQPESGRGRGWPVARKGPAARVSMEVIDHVVPKLLRVQPSSHATCVFAIV